MKRNSVFYLIFILMIIFGMVLYAHFQLGEYAFDDAYIYFRIVENYLDFGVPHFNLAEAVKAGTSTGWLVVLSASLWITRLIFPSASLIRIAEILNSVALVSGAILFTTLLIRLSGKRHAPVVWALFFVVYLFGCQQASLGLMETPTALALAGGGLLLYTCDRILSFSLLGAATFFRPEIAILFLLIFFHSIIKKRFPFFRIVAFSLLGALPFIFFDLVNYGTLVPNSMVAKSALYTLNTPQVITIFFSKLTSPYFLLPGYTTVRLILLFYLLYLTLFFIGVFLLRLKKSRLSRSLELRHELLAIILLWGFSTLGIYLVGNTFIFQWYMPLIGLPMWLILFTVILDSPSRRSYLTTLVMTGPLFILVIFVLIQTYIGTFWNPALYEGFSEGARVRRYIQTGRDLYARFPEKELMAPEIGGLGYGFRGRIIDSSGLAYPAAIQYHPLQVPEQRSNGGLGALPVALVQSVKPDLVVSFDIFIETFLESPLVGDYQITVLPPFIPEDMKHAIFRTPWGKYQRTLWGIQNFYVFIQKN